MKHKIQAACAALLALLLALPLPAAAEGSVHIRTAEDWEQLVRDCTLDTWSQGKTVVLECDLDLDGGGSIPTFGGVFDGGGHTISGLSITGGGSRQGLFRYVQEGAVVQNLTVSGRVAPGGDWEALGGVAGVNRGTILNCSFQGVVRGGGSVGGIAGVNESSGQIVRCAASGLVSGGHSSGGVAGENYGHIIQCASEVRVNTQEADASPELDGIDWSDLNSTQNFPACTDSGGIAGYSKGSLQACVNRGQVGYPHTGYNVGGIAGRQAGYLCGCENQGLVQGRKDVGGIVGQMEPYTLLRYEEDTLLELTGALDGLAALLSGALDHADGTRQQIAQRISAITGLTGDARRDVFDLLDDVAGLLDGSIDTANDLSGRVAELLDGAVPALRDLTGASDLLTSAAESLEDALSAAGGAETELSAAIEAAQSAAASLRGAADTLNQTLEQMKTALREGQGLSEALRDGLAGLSAAADGVRAALNQLESALPHLRQTVSTGALGRLRLALRDLEAAGRRLSGALKTLEELLSEQAERPALEFPKLDSGFYSREEQLNRTLASLTDSMEDLNRLLDSGGGDLSGDLRQINRQFQSITELLRNSQTREERELVVDVSEEELTAATLGKAERCVNGGAVEGDLNVGGVAGAMAIEFDFDPEDDTARQGSDSWNFQYLTSAVLLRCVSRGPVTARKDCAGGIVGRMDLGILAECENYGTVESTGGNYVGGVAGLADSAIRSSWAKCSLFGGSYIGGIAGSAKDLSGCGAIVQILEGSAYVGAIAGESGGTLRENRFVGETLGGVDGISYAGQAEPVSYEEFLKLPGIPGDFSSFTWTFTADGKTVAAIPVRYGQPLKDVPEVPRRDGFYGAWESFDRDNPRFDATIEAVYTPWITLLEAGDVLAEGQFSPNDTLRVEASSKRSPSSDAPVLGGWTVESSAPFTALRISCPKGVRRAAVWSLDGQGRWEELPARRVGSFLRVELESSAATVCLVDTGTGWVLPLVLLAGLAVLGLAWRLAHKKRPEKKPPAAARSAGNAIP